MSLLLNLEGYDSYRAEKALDMLLIDRKNEFRELADTMNIPMTWQGWERSILKFCLDFDAAFETLSSKMGRYDYNRTSHANIHKCMTLMRQLARGKKTVTEFTHLQNIAYTLAQEFKVIYRRIE